MIRIVHTACAALLVAVALIAYGVKEETRALQREIESVESETERVEREIESLQTEWGYLNSPLTLRRIAQRLYGRDGMVGVEGAALAAWEPHQARSLAPVESARSQHERIAPLLAEIEKTLGGIETATIPSEPAEPSTTEPTQ